ncbi:sporulation peptidase YabG [Priestia endophytica]|jgi:spore coat assembly protein|uniref:Sporulation peptidase YabG n=1 Tax=Priestia endophytica TaxID=135735 RepID=A0AAX1Q5V3_9BACI|nr:sporulation peptidase YabG [Priestia endophytica]RAS75019.1 sporulation peptidase YabG [Priestia endophytica]RAS92685.1 sporulation peptidase YabG [Priestia endophytica]
MNINVGDIVARSSYNRDVLFRVIDIQGGIAVLYGEEVRLVADAPLDDLEAVQKQEYMDRKSKEEQRIQRSFSLIKQDYELTREQSEYEATNGYEEEKRFFQLPGKVLHVDGDASYLQKCLTFYEKLNIPVYGVHCLEKEMPQKVPALIDEIRPDILVITGHDAYSKSKGKKGEIEAYRHSKHFVETVHEVRKRIPNLDQLVIFAGACQSHFESLIGVGANFASSPSRVNIHALDPVYIVAKISFTPFTERIRVWDVLRNTLTGEKGIGGIETKGLLRTGMPYNILEE